jgi:predicted transposase YbfD/YdcC
VLGQSAVDAKTNEITAIPELLSLLDIENSIITIDAMDCQKKIAEKIIKQKADYTKCIKYVILYCLGKMSATKA